MTIPRGVLAIGIGLLVLASRPAAQSIPVPAAPAGVPVLVELFTSEGCSSCPPADDALRTLLASQPVAGAEMIGLEEHVDYWDQSGWHDPFSSSAFTARQSEYDARVFHVEPIYTPQAIIDGAIQMVGSRVTALEAAVASAARAPKARVSLSLIGLRNISTAPNRAGFVHVRVEIPSAVHWSGRAHLVLAITEDGLTSQVTGGENRNRDLHHAAVVRSLKTIDTVSASSAPFAVTRPLAIQSGWVWSHLRVVAFVQDRASHRVLGTGTIGLADERSSRVIPRLW